MREVTNSTIEQVDGLMIRIAEVMDGLKAENIIALDLRGVADLADFFLIATTRSVAQMRNIARRIQDNLKLEGIRPVAPIEDESPRWTILDYGDIVVHLFEKEAREHYQLEQVWGDAAETDWRAGTSS